MKIFKKEYILLLILAILCTAFYFLFLGHYKLIDVDEPRYAEAAREMLESSNWLTPYFNYDIRFDKPVLFYWLVALSYLIFGVTEFAARFPSAVMATLLVFFTYFFGRQTISRSFGFISALILASSLEFLAIGRMSITDMTLTFFICATIFSGFLADFSIKKKEDQQSKNFFDKYSDIIYWSLAYLFSGAAVLTKGPVGFILPAAIFGICFILTGTLKKNLRLKYIIPGVLIFLTVAVPWYYWMFEEHGMKFINYFFLEHNLSRFEGGKLGHEQPFYFYPSVIFLGMFPWMFYLVSSFIKYIPEVFKSIKNSKDQDSSSDTPAAQKFFRNSDISIFKNSDSREKVMLFLFVWFFVIFAFFSASSAKMVSYILPLFPACALLAGGIWDDYINSDKDEKIFKISSWSTGVICLLLGIGAVAAFIILLPKSQDLGLHYNSLAIPLLFFAMAGLLVTFVLKKQPVNAFFSLVLIMSGIIIITAVNIMTVVYNSAQIDLIKYVNISKEYNSGYNILVTCGLTKPSLVFYSKRKVPFINKESTDLLTEYLNSNKPVFIVTKKKNLEDISKKVKYNLVSAGERYSLISNVIIKK